MAVFQRWDPWFPCSRAYHRFRQHQTEINDLYWSLPPVAGYAEYIARRAVDTEEATKLFHAVGPNARRIAPTVGIWKHNFSNFQNWVRLSALMSAVSYLESYISTIIILALRSDPLLRYGQSRTVDGTTWLKRGVKDDVQDLVVPCVKGDWTSRISSFQRLFGGVPATLTHHVGDLERMRNLRNGIAHSFGRDPRFFEDPIVSSGKPERLAEERLQQWLGIISDCALAIDQQVHHNHIGDFEIVWQYHRWREIPRTGRERRYDPHAALSREIIRTYGTGPGRDYCKQLIKYYDNLI